MATGLEPTTTCKWTVCKWIVNNLGKLAQTGLKGERKQIFKNLI